MTRIMLVIAALCGGVLPAAAQVSAGLNELGGRGFIESGKYSNEDDASSAIEVQSYYGRFLTDRWSVGPSLNVIKFEGEDAQGGIAGFVNYHFGDTSGTVIPFIEGSAGRFFGGDQDPTFVAVGPGLKWFFGDGGGALTGTAFYRRQMFDEDDPPFASGVNEFGLNIGVAIFFGR